MKPLEQCQILFVGLGLIGGSMARGLKAALPQLALAAVDADTRALEQARADGVVDRVGKLQELAGEADLIVLALPPLETVDILPQLARLKAAHAVVTDVASIKQGVVTQAAAQGADFSAHFVPGHPIAGSEKSGYCASRPDLFQDRSVILTPTAESSAPAVALVNELWRQLGANVLGMTPARHDRVLAATSHLPHLLAFAMVEMLADQQSREDILRYAAGGFADFSRLASSDARMWSDIFTSNAAPVMEMLDHFSAKLDQLRQALAAGDHGLFMAILTRAKATRDEFIAGYREGQAQGAGETGEVSFAVEPGGQLQGRLRVPGDKSISHRAIMLGAIADGVTRISGFLEGEDALNTVAALRELGVTIVGPEAGEITLFGVGKDGLKAPRKPLDMGNSGTAMRLLAGLLAAQPFSSELTGDESLSRRPMLRVAEPLRQMGACIETGADGTPPLRISGKPLKGIHYAMPVASAQVKSALLLAGLYAEGVTVVTEPAPCRDHTERMLAGFACPVSSEAGSGAVSIAGGQRLQATSIEVPGDISSAAFFLVAASIAPGSELVLEHVGINPTRTGVINLLQSMGADIELENRRTVGGEPVADIRVASAPLVGITIPEEEIPLAIDEFPALFIAAACAEGDTELRGAAELRVKESDRIDAMAQGLRALGIAVTTFEDGIRISGGELGGAVIDSRGDHRIAMAFAVAALRASAPIVISNCGNVATSFPGFADLAAGLGLKLQVERGAAT